MCSPCPWPGDESAIAWCIFNLWLPYNFKPNSSGSSAAIVAAAARPAQMFDNTEAQKRQVIAMIWSAMSICAGESQHWSHFITYVAPTYQLPGKMRMWNLVKELDGEITSRINRMFSAPANGPWFLTSDGATSRGRCDQILSKWFSSTYLTHAWCRNC